MTTILSPGLGLTATNAGKAIRRLAISSVIVVAASLGVAASQAHASTSAPASRTTKGTVNVTLVAAREHARVANRAGSKTTTVTEPVKAFRARSAAQAESLVRANSKNTVANPNDVIFEEWRIGPFTGWSAVAECAAWEAAIANLPDTFFPACEADNSGNWYLYYWTVRFT